MTDDQTSDSDPNSCSVLHLVTDDMGNGVVRISLSCPATVAEAKAFAAEAEVMTLRDFELEATRAVVDVAFRMAGMVLPPAYMVAVRALGNSVRECFILSM